MNRFACFKAGPKKDSLLSIGNSTKLATPQLLFPSENPPNCSKRMTISQKIIHQRSKKRKIPINI